MGAPPYVPPTRPISTAMFWSNTFTFDPLYASDTVSQSAPIAGGLNVAGTPLTRGTVLYGPAPGTPITATTLLTTATTLGAARCILAVDTDTSGGQVTTLVYTQGKFLDTAMTFTSAGASSDVAHLWQTGIYVLTVEQRSGMLVPITGLPTTGGPLPQSLNLKDAATAVKEQVDAIKAAIEAFRPPGAYTPPPLTGGNPPWAIAAFGARKPTPEQQAQAQGIQQADDLAAKQTQELDKLKADYSKQLTDLAQKQEKEREQLASQNAAAISQAQQQSSNTTTTPSTPPSQ